MIMRPATWYRFVMNWWHAFRNLKWHRFAVFVNDWKTITSQKCCFTDILLKFLKYSSVQLRFNYIRVISNYYSDKFLHHTKLRIETESRCGWDLRSKSKQWKLCCDYLIFSSTSFVINNQITEPRYLHNSRENGSWFDVEWLNWSDDNFAIFKVLGVVIRSQWHVVHPVDFGTRKN